MRLEATSILYLLSEIDGQRLNIQLASSNIIILSVDSRRLKPDMISDNSLIYAKYNKHMIENLTSFTRIFKT